eukprot:5406725-Prymnesium_polylepis.1
MVRVVLVGAGGRRVAQGWRLAGLAAQVARARARWGVHDIGAGVAHPVHGRGLTQLHTRVGSRGCARRLIRLWFWRSRGGARVARAPCRGRMRSAQPCAIASRIRARCSSPQARSRSPVSRST